MRNKVKAIDEKSQVRFFVWLCTVRVEKDPMV